MTMKNYKYQIILKAVFVLCSLFFVLKGNAQQLETLIEEGLANNPEIQMFEDLLNL